MLTAKIEVLSLVMFGICLFLGGCGKRAQDNTIAFGKPPDVVFENDTPVWRGITVGEATREDVLSTLGPPEKIWSFGNREVFRYLPQGYEREMHDTNTYHKIILQDGVVQVILIEVWGYRYEELLDEIGEPEQLVDYAMQHNVALFPSKGIAAVLEGISDRYVISHLQYYVPTSLEGYLESWGQFHPEELPWQSTIPARIDLLGFIPGETRRVEVEDSLGKPDFEWLDRTSTSNRQIYYYRIPGTISNRFQRFVFEHDTLTWMNVEIRDDRYSIKDAIGDLGQITSVVRPHYSDVVLPIQYYIWPEKGIVLVAEMAKEYIPIQSESSIQDPKTQPNGADVVVALVRFEPLSLDEFIEQKLTCQITEEIGELY